MVKTLLSFLFFTCCLLLSAMAQKDSTAFLKLRYVEGRDTLPYRLLKPRNVNGSTTYPLVIFLHGAGERGNDNEKNIKHIKDAFTNNGNRMKFPCFVVAPQCSEKLKWIEAYNTALSAKPAKPMQQFINLLENILKEYPIDKSRIYITGVSMGGYGTWDLIARYPNKFAAAVPICGGGDENTASKIKHIPIWAFHGAIDDTVPPEKSRSMIKALQNAGGSPGYTEYPDVGHPSWVHAYKDPFLMIWMFRQKLPK
jgi:predicted peptidase